VTFFYNQSQSGWSETYYAPANDPRLFAQSLTPRFLANSVTWRNALTVLKGVRVSRIEPPRFSYLVRPYPSPQGLVPNSDSTRPDVVSTDAVCQLVGNIGATRRVFFRGISDFDTQRDEFGNDLLGTNLSKGIELFVKGMISYQFAIRYVSRPPNLGLVWQQIPSLEVALNDILSSEFRLDPALPEPSVGDYLSVVGASASQIPGFPRKIQVTGKRVEGGITRYKVPYALPGGKTLTLKNMRVTKWTPDYDFIRDWQFERFSERKTGRPFGQLRGRSKAKTVAR